MKDLLYFISHEQYKPEVLVGLLEEHPEVKFVSLMGVDIGGNATDEKVPVKLFIEDVEGFLQNGIQTDGSSVVLEGIATLNNARVDLVPDLQVNWVVDYNFYHKTEDGLPVGTLKIPAFLIHNNRVVGSRGVLQKAVNNFQNEVMQILKDYPSMLEDIGVYDFNEIDEVILTSATELEFWVRTPDDNPDIEKLSTSQVLKEQYWKRTQGSVRTAMEKSIIALEKLGLQPEMGHKEVGGVRSKIGIDGRTNHVMEQLEIDWKYSVALQCADNEILAREVIEDIFRSHGLEVTFAAKPLEEVAGSGEHTHVGVAVKLKNGDVRNLFSPVKISENYLSKIGYGALMGILKNYEVITPLITSTNDAFNRLKPGFEAPVCIVTSLGHNPKVPSRNRSILVGVIRDINNPMATRFEVRSPNPLSNTYVVIASLYQAMLDGILAVAKSGKSIEEVEKEISKKTGEEGFYLEKHREYRSEMDVFEHYSNEERASLFGEHPRTVWENITKLQTLLEKRKVLLRGDVFTEDILNAFKESVIEKWATEIKNRILINNIKVIRECIKLHTEDSPETVSLDITRWEEIVKIKNYLMKDTLNKKSLFTRIKDAVDGEKYELVSTLYLEMNEKMKELKELYLCYKRNFY